MMDAVRAWLTSIVVVSLLLSAAGTLLPEGALRRIGTFTGGLILAAAVLQPFAGNRFVFPDWDPARFEAAVREQQTAFERQYSGALARETAQRTAALIAERTGFPADVEVRETESVPLPYAVTLYGERDETAAAWIASELGIPAERQTWTGEQ